MPKYSITYNIDTNSTLFNLKTVVEYIFKTSKITKASYMVTSEQVNIQPTIPNHRF